MRSTGSSSTTPAGVATAITGGPAMRIRGPFRVPSSGLSVIATCALRWSSNVSGQTLGTWSSQSSKSSRSDYDRASEGFQRVDVAVSDLSAFVEDDGAFDRFRAHTHEAFFEVKWFVKGWGNNRDAKSRLAGRTQDLPRPTRKAPMKGAFSCAREDSNFHGPFGPQGPQPCASTNSATGAWVGKYSLGFAIGRNAASVENA
jgi:hypothetical protein